MLGGTMLTTTKNHYKDPKVGYHTQESYLRMKCPDCDKRRSGPCSHPSILNLKGNTK
jgi:ribosomal protein S27E